MESSYCLELFYPTHTQGSPKHEGHGTCCEASQHVIVGQSNERVREMIVQKTAFSTAIGHSWALAASGQWIAACIIIVLDQHDGLDGTFHLSIVLVSSDTGKMNNLLEMFEMIGESR